MIMKFLKWLMAQQWTGPALCMVGLVMLAAGNPLGILLIALVCVLLVKWQPCTELGAWPLTGAGSASAGVLFQGVTTLVWGTNLISGQAGFLTVLKVQQKQLVENMHLPNGDGPSSTRVQIIDGVQWEITVRDDTAQVPSGLKIGQLVTIIDGAGMVGTVATGGGGIAYSARVVENGWDTAPKQPGERTLTLEKLLLIETTGMP